jgi:hypothetical protein
MRRFGSDHSRKDRTIYGLQGSVKKMVKSVYSAECDEEGALIIHDDVYNQTTSEFDREGYLTGRKYSIYPS